MIGESDVGLLISFLMMSQLASTTFLTTLKVLKSEITTKVHLTSRKLLATLQPISKISKHSVLPVECKFYLHMCLYVCTHVVPLPHKMFKS